MSGAATRPHVYVARSAVDATADAVTVALIDGGCVVLPGSGSGQLSDAARTAAVRHDMDESGAMLIVASAETVGSPWTPFEMGAALATEKPIFAVPVPGGLMPTYMQPAEVVNVLAIGSLVQRLRKDARPLTDADDAALSAAYAEVGLPLDQLRSDLDGMGRVAEAFGKRQPQMVGPDRLLRELARLRKQGSLPSISRKSSTARTPRKR